MASLQPAPLYARGTPAPTGFQQAPPPSLNGGLYTGEPFRHGARYANVPVPPEAGAMMYGPWLRGVSAPGTEHHVPGGGLRPGNNTPLAPAGAIGKPFPELNLTCIVPTPRAHVPAPARAGAQAHGESLRKYAPW